MEMVPFCINLFAFFSFVQLFQYGLQETAPNMVKRAFRFVNFNLLGGGIRFFPDEVILFLPNSHDGNCFCCNTDNREVLC